MKNNHILRDVQTPLITPKTPKRDRDTLRAISKTPKTPKRDKDTLGAISKTRININIFFIKSTKYINLFLILKFIPSHNFHKIIY